MNHADADFIVGQLFQRLGDSFYRTLYVCLDDQGQFLHFALFDLAEQVIQSDLLVLVELRLLCLMLPLFYQFSCQTLIFYCVERIACFRHFCQTGDLYRYRRTSRFHCLPLIVGHDTHTADCGTCDNDIADVQGTVLYQQGSDWSASLVQTGFYDSTLCTAIRICLQFAGFCDQQNVFQQVVDALAGLCRNRYADHVAAPFFADHAVLGQFFLDAVRICTFLIHLVDSNNNGDSGSLGVIDRFDCLRHDTVIGSHNQNCNICDISTAGTHCCECFVTRCIQECDVLALIAYLICTDMLGNAAGFTCGNVSVTDSVQNGSLTVVNVTHNADNRAAFFGILGIVVLVDQTVFNGHDHFVLYLCTQFLCHQRCGIEIDLLVNGRHNAQHHQLLDDFGSGDFQTGRQFADSDYVRNADTQLLLSGTFQFQTTQLILFGFPLAGIPLLIPLCRLLVDLLLLGGISVVGILACRSDLLIPLVVLIQIDIRASGVYRAAFFGGDAVRRCHFHFNVQTLAVLLCLCLLLLGLFVLLSLRSCGLLFFCFLFRLRLLVSRLFVCCLFLCRLLVAVFLVCRFLIRRLLVAGLLFLLRLRLILGSKVSVQTVYLCFLGIILQCQIDLLRCQTGHTLFRISLFVAFLIKSDQFLCRDLQIPCNVAQFYFLRHRRKSSFSPRNVRRRLFLRRGTPLLRMYLHSTGGPQLSAAPHVMMKVCYASPRGSCFSCSASSCIFRKKPSSQIASTPLPLPIIWAKSALVNASSRQGTCACPQ